MISTYNSNNLWQFKHFLHHISVNNKFSIFHCIFNYICRVITMFKFNIFNYSVWARNNESPQSPRRTRSVVWTTRTSWTSCEGQIARWLPQIPGIKQVFKRADRPIIEPNVIQISRSRFEWSGKSQAGVE